MKVRYGSYRANDEDMTGREVEMTEAEARPLLISNIVVKVETASVEPSRNAMLERVKPRRLKNGAKAKNRSRR